MITRDDALRQVVEAVSDLSKGLREHSRRNTDGVSAIRDDLGELGDRIDGVLSAVRRLAMLERPPAPNGVGGYESFADSEKEPSLVFVIPGHLQFAMRKQFLRRVGQVVPWAAATMLGLMRALDALLTHLRGAGG